MNIKYPFIILFLVLLCSESAVAMEEHIKAHIDANKQQPGSSFFWAVQTNQIKDVQKLLSKDLDINASYVRREFNPLQHAVKKGHDQMVQFLIESGADVNYIQQGGAVPFRFRNDGLLDSAVQLDYPIMARLLLLQGVALGDRVGVESPFVRCNGNVEMIRTLIVTPQGLPEPGNDWVDLHDRLFTLMCCIKRRCGKKIHFNKDMRRMLCQYVINDGIVRDPTKDRKVIRQEQSAFLYCTRERKNCIHISSDISELPGSSIAQRVVPYSMATLCHAAIFGLLDKQNNGRILDQFTDKHIIMVSNILGDLKDRHAISHSFLRKKGWSEAAITLFDNDTKVLNSNFGKKIKNEYKQLIFGKGNGRKRK